MENQILNEIQEVRKLLSILVGTSDEPEKEKFSMEALNKAALEFKVLTISRGEWVKESEISKIIKKAPWRASKFIIEKFGFVNYFKHDRTIYFNKKDLIALNNELKERNINLSLYIDLLEDKEKFQKKIDSLKTQNKKRKHFQIPAGLKNIESIPYSAPSKEIVKEHISALMDDFKKFKLSEYVDIFDDSYAMIKSIYYFDRYLKPELKKQCRKWCEDFNYANHALKEIKNIRSEPIKE